MKQMTKKKVKKTKKKTQYNATTKYLVFKFFGYFEALAEMLRTAILLYNEVWEITLVFCPHSVCKCMEDQQFLEGVCL